MQHQVLYQSCGVMLHGKSSRLTLSAPLELQQETAGLQLLCRLLQQMARAFVTHVGPATTGNWPDHMYRPSDVKLGGMLGRRTCWTSQALKFWQTSATNPPISLSGTHCLCQRARHYTTSQGTLLGFLSRWHSVPMDLDLELPCHLPISDDHASCLSGFEFYSCTLQ